MLQGNNETDSLQNGDLRLHAPRDAGSRLPWLNPGDTVNWSRRENKRRVRDIHLVGDGSLVRRGGSRIILTNFCKSGEAGHSNEQQKNS